MPERIQRKRTKGWKMPENTVSVTRPGEWGNPFVIGGHFKMGGLRKSGLDALMVYLRCYGPSPGFTTIETAEQAVEWYKIYLERMPKLLERIKKELRGKNLACWCKPGEPCHADVLLELANKD